MTARPIAAARSNPREAAIRAVAAVSAVRDVAKDAAGAKAASGMGKEMVAAMAVVRPSLAWATICPPF
jgi:hypothetical protein